MICRICEQRVSKRLMPDHSRLCVQHSQLRLELESCDARLRQLSSMLGEKELERRRLHELDQQLAPSLLPPALTPLLMAGRLLSSFVSRYISPPPSDVQPVEQGEVVALPDSELLRKALRAVGAAAVGDVCQPSLCEEAAGSLKQISEELELNDVGSSSPATPF